MGKKKNIVTILIFLAVLAAPGVVMVGTPGREHLPNEGRMSVGSEDVFSPETGLNRQAAETFVNDNIGFRSFATTADIAVKFELFRFYPPYNHIQGKDGQIFYTPFNKAYPDQIQPFDPLTNEQYAEAKERLTYVDDWFKEHDSRFLFVTVPEKQSVYPEYYPDTVLAPVEDARLERFALRIGDETDVNVLDLSEALRAAKVPDEMLYNVMGDSVHWNPRGAFVGYQAIMTRLQQENPALFILSENDLNISKKREPVQTADKLYTFPNRSELIYTYEIKDPKARLLETSITMAGVNQMIPGGIMEQIAENGFGDLIQHFENPDREGKLLLIGDSYLHQYLLPYFAESYEETYFIVGIWDWEHLRELIDLYEPDTVVYELSAMNFREDHLTLTNLEGFRRAQRKVELADETE